MGKNIKLKSLVKEEKKYYQDGANFYDEDTGKLIASYKQLVKNDYDMQGAKQAQEKFLTDHPEYKQMQKIEVKEQMSSDKYIIEAIRDFISSSDTSSPYKPQIKLHWGGDSGESNTKWLSITWDDALSILEYFEEK